MKLFGKYQDRWHVFEESVLRDLYWYEWIELGYYRLRDYITSGEVFKMITFIREYLIGVAVMIIFTLFLFAIINLKLEIDDTSNTIWKQVVLIKKDIREIKRDIIILNMDKK